MAYPQPSANDPIQMSAKRTPSTYVLPPPNQIYAGIVGSDYAPNASEQIHGFPSHTGGYRTTPDGLNISATPWHMYTKYPSNRRDRANYEAMIEAYWPTSPKFGPQGSTPSYNALLT